ncbi:MAG: hypothetical protein AB8B92_11530 [Gammaproteobacteria bacterium]
MKKESRKIKHNQCQQLLKLFEAQLDGARQEILERTHLLSASFETLFDTVYELQLMQKDAQGVSRETLNKKLPDMNRTLVTCVSSMQFTDEVCQRIEHLSSGIESVRELLDDEINNNECVDWAALTDEIEKSYSVHQELEIFSNVMHGVSSKKCEPFKDLF